MIGHVPSFLEEEDRQKVSVTQAPDRPRGMLPAVATLSLIAGLKRL